jgi:Leucine-rich repeat (LRR) protein
MNCLIVQLQEVPASLDDASAFSSVRTIDLTSNKLSHVPPFLGSFSVLLRLTLSRNQLTQLPTEVSYLTSLKVSPHAYALCQQVCSTLVAPCRWKPDNGSPHCC